MDIWMKVGSAVLIVMMLVFIWPRARHMLRNSPKGSTDDWKGALIPLVLVVVFIFILIKLV